MFTQSPELYDLIYGSFKDYSVESAAVAALLDQTAPGAHDILDVGCGTGEHARYLHCEHGYQVDGLDIEPGFNEIARAKLPGSSFWQRDMTEFSLGKSYDAVLCLFGSIAYVSNLERLRAALSSFRAHLRSGGIALVEPWLSPDEWNPGRVYVHTAESENLRVVRMSHSSVRGHVSVLRFHYLIGTPEGVEHREETHELGLFTRDEILSSFAEAGFDSVDYDPEGLIGRGMYVARTGS
ncbi:MAG: class I SAM-dependent methyltransferase [Candidatus Palauibacterales bacterium]|nr:class I SAM-dependent methyltransferase [Candidatus Palauibacterales bacterium]